MPRVEFIEHIDAPAQKVWDFISNLDRVPEWVTLTKEMHFVSDRPPKEGTVYRELTEVAGFATETEWRISAFDPPHRQVHETEETMLSAVLTMAVEPEGDGARLLHRSNFKMMPKVRPLGWLIERLFGQPITESELSQTVQNAKRIIEAEHEPG
ncbi:MAG: SRPBCC family protein [Candidatus Promineifilaceae bacterium]|nr:SRPBCC family protein [Candidatus Promineifilaceae bacterium]